MIVFVHFTDGGTQGGVERYGRILASGGEPPGPHAELEVKISGAGAERPRPPAGAGAPRYVFQYSRHFHDIASLEKACELLEALDSPSAGHRIVVHDALSLPTPIDTAVRSGLIRRPRALLRALAPDQTTRIRQKLWARLSSLGCRAVVLHERQKLHLPQTLRRTAIVAPHFIEPPWPLPDTAKAKAQLGLSGRSVLTVLGWLNPRKQYELAIEALAHMPEEFCLVLAGSPMKAFPAYADRLLEQAARLGLSSRVRITGYLSEHDQAVHMSATDLGLCLFKSVSASGSFCSWIANGIPVLTADLPELRMYGDLLPGSVVWSRSNAAPAVADAAQSACGRRPAPEALARLRQQFGVPATCRRILQ